MEDIVLDNNDDLTILAGDFLTGESTLQEVGIIIRLTQGNLKEFPTLGPNLFQLLNSNASQEEVTQRVMIHLAKDNKNYNEMKSLIEINMKKL